MTFNLNKEKAKASASTRISEKGAYVGMIKRAEVIVNEKGNKYIEFSFVTESKQSADYLQVYISNGNGEELLGAGLIHAMMAILGIDSMNEAEVEVEKYNSSSGRVEKVKRLCYAQLHKKMGLILRRREYISATTGEVKSSMEIVMPFHPDTRQTSSEVLSGQTNTKTVDNIVADLKDKIVEPPKTYDMPTAADFDDDVDF